ncbi:hypothetical protein I4U23_004661 [Adineta vaga]|nr:hypothetical protein I4U23_004661 [Adineta vaga]
MLIYRKEIDGLRALALLPVILYHAGLTLLVPGGYVGVDIFFVISGYLITSLIDMEFREGTFSLIRFYERRCRRILPALYIISCIICYFAYYWMSSGQLREFGYSLISIVTFSSNIFFWWKDDNYFSRLTELNPVVHTWSLAVEEQFYLVFPLLCYLFARKRRYLFTLLGLLALLSFCLAQWGGNIQSISNMTFYMFLQHSWASFYMPMGRMWELLLGAFVAFYLRYINFSKECVCGLQNHLTSGHNFMLSTLVDHDIIPTFGTALIIIYGNHDTLVGYLLSIRPLRWVDLISYSAYLWHQPLLVYLRLQQVTMANVSYSTFVVGASFLLATLTYVLVEQPFRAFLLFLIALFLIRTANHRSIIVVKTVRNRSLNLREEIDTYIQDIEPIELSNYVTRRFDSLMKAYPTFSVQSATTNRRLLLIGDSFAQDFVNMMVETHHLVDYELRCHYVRVYCQIYMGPEDRLQWISPAHRQLCINENDIRLALPLISQANLIILAGVKKFGPVNLTLYMNKSYEYRVQQLQPSEDEFVKVNKIMKQTLKSSMFVDVLNMTCNYDNGTCPVFTPEGKLISYDGWHTTKHGARYVGNIIFKQFPLNQL